MPNDVYTSLITTKLCSSPFSGSPTCSCRKQQPRTYAYGMNAIPHSLGSTHQNVDSSTQQYATSTSQQ